MSLDNAPDKAHGTTAVCPKCDRHISDCDKLGCMANTTTLAAPQRDPLIGTVIAHRYEILSSVGIGGWGHVYKARHVELNKVVAVKMLHQHLLGNREKVQRFEQEARAACSLAHENIATVHDYGKIENGQPYFVMEYLDGISLESLIKKTRITDVQSAIDLFQQICAGLSAAHRKGIVHRDIKPSNVFVQTTPDGQHVVKLLDFGLAKLMYEDGSSMNQLTQTGETLGTPAYMSPEQCTGGKLDPRSDIYSLGCLMYEALSGVQPFAGSTAFECMTRHVGEMPPPLARAAEEVVISPNLENTVFKCLEKQPRNRYQTAMEVQASLNEVQQDRSKSNSIFSASMQQKLREARHTLQSNARTISMLLACLVLCSGGVGWLVLEQLKNDPANLPPLDRWHHFFGRAHKEMNSGRYKEADMDLRSALATAETFAAVDDKVLCLQNKALVFRLMGDYPKEYSTDAILERVTPPTNEPETLAHADQTVVLTSLISQLRQKPQKLSKEQLITLGDQLNQLCFDIGADKTEPVLKEAEPLFAQLLGPTTATYARTVEHLAYARFLNNDDKSALKLWLKCKELRDTTVQHTDFDYSRILGNIGTVYIRLKNPAEAARYLTEATDLQESSTQTPVRIRSSKFEDLALAYELQNKYTDAYETRKRIMHLYDAVRDYGDADYSVLNVVYAGVKAGLGARVESDLLVASDKLKNQFGSLDLGVAAYSLGLTEYHRMQGDFTRAEKTAWEGLRIRQQLLPPYSYQVRRSMEMLARVYMAEHKYAEALPLYKELLAIAQRSETKDNDKGFKLDALIKLAYCSSKIGAVGQSQDYMNQFRDVLYSIGNSSPNTDCTRCNGEVFSAMHGSGLTKTDLNHMAHLIKKQKRVVMRDDGLFGVPCAETWDAISRIAAINSDYRLAADADYAAIKALGKLQVNPFVAGGIYAHYASVLRKLGNDSEANKMDSEAHKYPREII